VGIYIQFSGLIAPMPISTQYFTHTALCSFDRHSLSTSVLLLWLAHHYIPCCLAGHQETHSFHLSTGLICHSCLSHMFNFVAVTVLTASGTLGCSITFHHGMFSGHDVTCLAGHHAARGCCSITIYLVFLQQCAKI
jgi:hypothetical protein